MVCDICDIATVLDPASAAELLSMYPIENLENQNPKKTTVTSYMVSNFTSNHLVKLSSSNKEEQRERSSPAAVLRSPAWLNWRRH